MTENFISEPVATRSADLCFTIVVAGMGADIARAPHAVGWDHTGLVSSNGALMVMRAAFVEADAGALFLGQATILAPAVVRSPNVVR
jgi:hypothetical protein